MESNLVLKEAISSILAKKALKSPDLVVNALITTEKSHKKAKIKYSFDQLIGTWKLCFVTGTKKARKRAGVILGEGKYLPKFFKITIAYNQDKQVSNRGTVENCVNFKALQISLSGLVKFIEPRNILVFDFTRMHLVFLGITLYKGYIRSGKEKEASFYKESIAKQAFFTYFYVSEKAIAARGKGGGLAIWIKDS